MTRSHLLAAALGVLLGVLLSLFVVDAASRAAAPASGASNAPLLRGHERQPGAPQGSVVGATPTGRTPVVAENGPEDPPGKGSAGGAPFLPALRFGELVGSLPAATALVTQRPPATWHHDPEVSFFGPGLYGRRTACGLALTTRLLGVAHRSLPCGTLVSFRWRGRTLVVPVVDRGPYVAGRTWDLTGGACVALRHCWTGPIEVRLP